MRRLLFVLAFTGCATEPSTSSTSSALTCWHTTTQVLCAPSGEVAEERTKVEDFYPSACLDGDADADGTPDFLDIDFIGTDVAVARDELRCPKCNRGPGTQNDFRLRVAGSAAQLDRGKVYARSGDRLTVPTPDGVLTVVIDAATRIDDGEPTPGAEIRVEGEVVNGEVHATRLKVLCGAPDAVPPTDVPPVAEPPRPDPAGPIFL